MKWIRQSNKWRDCLSWKLELTCHNKRAIKALIKRYILLLYRPEAGVVSTVCNIQDTGHLPGCVCFHLAGNKTMNFQANGIHIILTCSNSDSRLRHFASQNWISVRGPGVFPSSSSAALSLPRTSSVCDWNIELRTDYKVTFILGRPDIPTWW